MQGGWKPEYKKHFETTRYSTADQNTFCIYLFLIKLRNVIQWNLYSADTFGTFPSVRLIEVCIYCAMFVNDQHSAVILYCDKVPRC